LKIGQLLPKLRAQLHSSLFDSRCRPKLLTTHQKQNTKAKMHASKNTQKHLI